VRTLLGEADAFLDAGLASEAAAIYGRVLLLDPGHVEAARGLVRAREASAETQRRREAGLDDGAAAAFDGRPAAPAAPAEDGANDRPEGVPREPGLPVASGPFAPLTGGDAPVRQRRPTPVSRQALVAVWTAIFVTLAVGLAFSWDRLVDDLVSAPAPASTALAPPATEPDIPPGEIAVSRAREMVARGDLMTALAILDEVSPSDPEYPFARQLRGQVVAAMTPERPSR
jgi:hypothetical protein